jgi:hypothetical protein
MKIKLIALLAPLLILTGCHHYFKETSAQYERMPIKSLKNPTKEGKACGSYLFPLSLLYSKTDISVETARKNGDISEISTIEREESSVVVYTKICTIVKGN